MKRLSPIALLVMMTVSHGALAWDLIPPLSSERSPDAPRPEDWTFTREEYSALLRDGGELRFASDSDWFPAELKANLLATIRFALDPASPKPSAESISARDFYHGHIACDGEIADRKSIAPLYSDLKELFAKHGLTGTYPSERSTPEQLALYAPAVREAETLYGAALTTLLERKLCPQPVVVYHTFEMSGPSDGERIAPGGPRRNLLTRNAASEGDSIIPQPYSPPEIKNASSWTNQFASIHQFAFLVDRDGVVHVTYGTIGQLSARIAGRWLSQF